MDFSMLPVLPTLLHGESRQSWMRAIGILTPVLESDWREMVGACHREPEHPAKGRHWKGLPVGLGNIRDIEPRWRLGTAQRYVYCSKCYVKQRGVRRWPTCTSWLDARQLTCLTHRLPLVYRYPGLGVDHGHTACKLEHEMIDLYDWTHQWMLLDRSRELDARAESRWRHDLVHAAIRNWALRRSRPNATVGARELAHLGWRGQGRMEMQNPGYPGRLGDLAPPERIGGLLLAHRCWRYFSGEPKVFLPSIPIRAWQWLARRQARSPSSRSEAIERLIRKYR